MIDLHLALNNNELDGDYEREIQDALMAALVGNSNCLLSNIVNGLFLANKIETSNITLEREKHYYRSQAELMKSYVEVGLENLWRAIY